MIAGTDVELVLARLAAQAGLPGLVLAGGPTPLQGGYYAQLFRFRLAEPPPGLPNDLVARLVPSPVTGEWEAIVQRRAADAGFPTPRVHLAEPLDDGSGRYLIVMDLLEGRPPLGDLDDLNPAALVRSIPRLVRDLPATLASVSARLHAIDPGPTAAELDTLDSTAPKTTAEFVIGQAIAAEAISRRDLVLAAERLLATEPPPDLQVICHGDLHPLNVVMTPTGAALVDWSVSRIAHPAFDVALTELLLGHPPLVAPTGTGAALQGATRYLARRFVAAYRKASPNACAVLQPAAMDFNRGVHALRMLVELAGWDAAGTRPPGHPWVILEPVARAELALP